jgi:hypothetical protein
MMAGYPKYKTDAHPGAQQTTYSDMVIRVRKTGPDWVAGNHPFFIPEIIFYRSPAYQHQYH